MEMDSLNEFVKAVVPFYVSNVLFFIYQYHTLWRILV